MYNKVTVSGCSFTYNATWPDYLFSGSKIRNLARAGAGNRFIGHSVISSVLEDRPDFVFILWSGVNRCDLAITDGSVAKELTGQTQYRGQVDSTCYLFSGGDKYNSSIVRNYQNIRDDSWPDVGSLDDFLLLPKKLQEECTNSNLFWWNNYGADNVMHNAFMSNYIENGKSLEDQTYLTIMQTLDFLDKQKIPHKFGFIYNPFDADNQKHFGCLSHNSKYHGCIDWGKYVTITPYEFGIKYNYLSNDQYHLTKDGMEQWADNIRKFIF